MDTRRTDRADEALVVLTGLPAAGKTTVAHFLQEAGFLRIDVAALLQEEMKVLGWPVSRPRVGPKFVSRVGEARIFDLISQSLVGRSSPTVVDSVRLATTCRALREAYPRARIWHIVSSESERTQRLHRRVEMIYQSDKARQAEALDAYSAYDSEEEAIRLLADVVIDNVVSVEGLRDIVSALVSKADD